jgi:hypothetical protein
VKRDRSLDAVRDAVRAEQRHSGKARWHWEVNVKRRFGILLASTALGAALFASGPALSAAGCTVVAAVRGGGGFGGGGFRSGGLGGGGFTGAYRGGGFGGLGPSGRSVVGGGWNRGWNAGWNRGWNGGGWNRGWRGAWNQGWHGGWNRGWRGGNWNRRGWRGGWWPGYAGLGLGLGLGYGLSAWDYGYPYDYAYGYGYPYDYGSGYGYPAAATAAPLVTGRSVATGQMGNYCTTPVKTCQLYNASYIGNGCSCRVSGGRSRGTVFP